MSYLEDAPPCKCGDVSPGCRECGYRYVECYPALVVPRHGRYKGSHAWHWMRQHRREHHALKATPLPVMRLLK